MLRKVPGLLAAADLVIVADSAAPRGDVNRPVVMSVVAIRAVAWDEMGNFDREVTWGDADSRVPVVYNLVLGLWGPPKARGVRCGAGTQKGSARCNSGRGASNLPLIPSINSGE
jgi:hypothetical protein